MIRESMNTGKNQSMKMIINPKQGEKMKRIALVSKDKKDFKVFSLNTITRIDVNKINSNPDDEKRGICIFEGSDCCTHTYEIVYINFDHFVSFINGNGINDDVFIINVETIEV